MVVLPCCSAQGQAPPNLTLPQAVARALEANPMRAAAVADRDAAASGVREARAELLPSVSFSEGFTRSTDPVFVFGTKLRQERFTAADFALAELNTPAPINNFSTRIWTEWSLFDSGGKLFKLARSKRLSEAADLRFERTEQEIAFRAVEAYLAVLEAEKQRQVAEQSLRTAEAVRDRSQARVAAGVAVESDLLSARVNLAERQHQLLLADNAAKLARAQLNSVLGEQMGTGFELAEVSDAAPPAVEPLEALEQQALAKRPDLRRIEAQLAAQAKSVSAAKSAFGPRVNLFAGWEAHNQELTSGGNTNWTGGVELQFDLFQGGAKAARLSRERAGAARLAALRQAAQDAVRLEVRRAYYDLDAARQHVEVMRAAMSEAGESLRITQNRYDAGLNTITDLLRVEETSRRTQSDYWGAVFRLRRAQAALELATGILGPHSPAVQP
ncbi:MAG TPA: TolC family protein [Terriglobales bacterium]|nr:TolC family protein [Terriglobales bacterium]